MHYLIKGGLRKKKEKKTENVLCIKKLLLLPRN